MNPLLWLLVIPGVLWWLFVVLFGCGWWLAARDRRRRNALRLAVRLAAARERRLLQARARAVLTPDADLDIPLDDTPSARELQQWFALPSQDKEH